MSVGVAIFLDNQRPGLSNYAPALLAIGAEHTAEFSLLRYEDLDELEKDMKVLIQPSPALHLRAIMNALRQELCGHRNPEQE